MSTSFDALKQREEKLLCRTYGRYPIAIKRGEGARLYDFEGKEYIDLLAGIAVTNVGHCRPELAEVMAEQARKLVHVSNLFYQEEQLELAEKIQQCFNQENPFLDKEATQIPGQKIDGEIKDWGLKQLDPINKELFVQIQK